MTDIAPGFEPMADLLGEEGSPFPEPEPEFVCETCGQSFLSKAGLGSHRNTHKTRPAKAGKKDASPTSIKVEMGTRAASPAKDKDLQAVEDNARQLVQWIAAITLMVGQGEDALILQKGSGPWASSVRELAAHEEWLRKIMAGGETSARALAWIQFLTATGAIALPILLHHGMLPDNFAAMATGIFESGPGEPSAAA